MCSENTKSDVPKQYGIEIEIKCAGIVNDVAVFGAADDVNSMKNIHYRFKEPLYKCKDALPGWTIDIDDLTGSRGVDFLIEVVTKPQTAANLKKSITALRNVGLHKCDKKGEPLR